jgi:Protein of unknown function (DUF2809)
MTSPKVHRSHLKYQLALSFSLIITVVLGLMTKFYRGAGQEWLNNSFGGVPYEIVWILLIALLFTNASPLGIAIGVCLVTCGLEFLQLWQPPLLQSIRATLPGQLILGNTFNGSDFLYYVIGSFLGWLWVRSLRRAIVADRR